MALTKNDLDRLNPDDDERAEKGCGACPACLLVRTRILLDRALTALDARAAPEKIAGLLCEASATIFDLGEVLFEDYGDDKGDEDDHDGGDEYDLANMKVEGRA